MSCYNTYNDNDIMIMNEKKIFQIRLIPKKNISGKAHPI